MTKYLEHLNTSVKCHGCFIIANHHVVDEGKKETEFWRLTVSLC
jgi:hypothetical protein